MKYLSSKWSISTLIWLPLLMPTLALWLELIPRTYGTSIPEVYLYLIVVSLVAWLFTALLGAYDGDGLCMMLLTVAVCVAGIVAADAGLGVALVVLSCVALGAGFNKITYELSGIVVDMVLIGVAVGVATVGVATVGGGIVVGIVAFIVVGIVAFIIVIPIIDVLADSIKKYRIAYLTLLVTAHLCLISYCFL